MRRIILLLLLIPFISLGQIKEIDGFSFVKLGMSKAQVMDKMRRNGTITVNETGKLKYENPWLGRRWFDSVTNYFANDKLVTMLLFLGPETDSKLIPYYNSLLKEVGDVIGEGVYNTEFDPPYSWKDGRNLEAIKAGKARIWAEWVDAKGNSIVITLFKEGLVEMAVRNSAMTEITNRMEKGK